MAEMTRRAISAELTRAAILRAARTAFGIHGFANASLASIAKSADATTGALYHHFPDKRSLFAAVAESVEAEIAAHLTAAAPQTTEVWELVEYAVLGSLDFAARPEIARIIFDDAPNVVGAAAWREIEMRYGFGVLTLLLTSLDAAGRLAGGDPALVAAMFLGSLINTAEAIATSTNPTERLRSGRTAMLRMIRAFRTDGPSPRADE